MLQTFRDNLKGTVAFFIIGIIVVIFALTGVDALFVANSKSGQVASVNGENIGELELRRNMFLTKQQMMSRYGDRLPPEYLSDDALREPVLKELLDRKVMEQFVESHGYVVSEATLDQIILKMPQFQLDGAYSPQQFKQMVGNMGYTPLSFRQTLKTDYVLNQFNAGLMGSAFITRAELERLIAISYQTRDFDYLTLSYSQEVPSIELTDEEITAYYQQHQAQYQSQEQAVIQYIDVSVDALMQSVDVSDAELEQQFKQELDNFNAQTERHAAHILLNPDQENLVAEIQQKLAAGEDFATLAKTYSSDVGSSSMGGDLGFTDGTVFPEEFESALAGLTVGEVSGPVQTDAGIHLIKLLEVTDSTPPTFAERKVALRESIARAKAEAEFVSIIQALPDLTYNADDLQIAAEDLNLQVQTSPAFSRAGGEGILADPKVIAATFSKDVLQEGHNSELLELSESHVAVLRLKEHLPQRLLTLEEVRADVEQAVVAERVQNVLTSRASDYIEKAKSGESLETIASTLGFDWQQESGVTRMNAKADRSILAKVFNMAINEDGSGYDTTRLPNGDVVVIHLSNAEPGVALPEPEADQLAQSVENMVASSERSQVHQALTETAEVEVY